MEIGLLRKHGLSLRKIAEEIGCAVNTVRNHLDTEMLPVYKRKTSRVTKLSPFGDYLRERQAAAHPAWIPATVLLRSVDNSGRHPFRPQPGVDAVARIRPGLGIQALNVAVADCRRPRCIRLFHSSPVPAFHNVDDAPVHF